MSFMHQVSQSELFHMREDGMSNHEIAKALDVSYQTVLRAIGKQPAGMRKAPVRNFVPPVNAAPVSRRKQEGARLSVLNRTVSLMGELAEYFLNCSEELLTVKVGEGVVCVPFQKLGLLTSELTAIRENLPLEKAEGKAW